MLPWLPSLHRSAKTVLNQQWLFQWPRGLINPPSLPGGNMNCCIWSNLLLMWKCRAVCSIRTEPELLSWTKVHFFARQFPNSMPLRVHAVASPAPLRRVSRFLCVCLSVWHTHIHTLVYFWKVYFPEGYFPKAHFFKAYFSKIHFPETYFPKTYFPEAYFPKAYFPKNIFYVSWFLVRICGEIQSSCWSSFEFDLSAATCMMES